MADERSDAVRLLCAAVLRKDSSERAAYLDGVSDVDPKLREGIESLLASHEAESLVGKPRAGDEVLAAPPETVAQDQDSITLVREPRSTEEGRFGSVPNRIGPYSILREIGHGGMGIVYEAEQREPQRLVALKVIRGEQHVDERHVRLFQREAQALARLKHPHIATIHEAGRTEDGFHFFAMELVRGESLSDYCRKRELHGPWKRLIEHKLRLFLQVCEAVNYAHQRGVIHRDLKPSNVLVSEDLASGSKARDTLQIKVLDFGLARIIDPENDAASMSGIGRIEGTLPYMSPEQARGNPEEIDVRADVYSLGVILYEMVTGQRPYRVDIAAPLEALRVICEQEPRRPSEVMAEAMKEAEASGSVDADLESIILKALEKTPAQRYQSALALAEDIERYLDNRPILARPPSAVYQLQKLVARHKLGFAFAFLSLVVVIAFGIVMALQAARIASARDRAEREASKAQAINGFLQKTLGSANPYGGSGQEVTVLQVLADAARQIDGTFGNQPELKAAVQNTIGVTYRDLGRYQEAEPLLRSALAIRKSRLGETHIDVAESLNELGIMLYNKGDLEGAERILREALAIHRDSLRGMRPAVPGKPNDAALEVATSLNNLAMVLQAKGDYDAGEVLHREALETRRELLGGKHPHVATSLNNLGILLYFKRDYAGAEALFREAVAVGRELYGEEHPYVATSLNNLARVLMAKGDYDGAEPLFREALATNRKLLGEKHSTVAMIMGNLARVLCEKGDDKGASQLFDEAVILFSVSLGADHWRLAGARSDYAMCLIKRTRYSKAEEQLRAAYPVLREKLGADHEQFRQAAERLSELYEAWGKAERAAEYRAVLQDANVKR